MGMYLVYFESKNGDAVPEAAEKLINDYDGVRFHPGGWIIAADRLTESIHRELAQQLSENDYVIVTKITDDIAFTLPENIERWIRRNLLR